MAQQSKFSGALSRLRTVPTPDETEAEAPAAPAIPAAPEPDAVTLEVTRHPDPVVRGRGRPAGKRSDPAFEPTTLLLRKQTKRTAGRLLEDGDSRQDLSDLVEHLLTQWSKRQL